MACIDCDCYNGCVQTTTDQCVRYTGNEAPVLGIATGDPLLTVEQALIDYVISFLNGTGIIITVNPAYYCELVSQYLGENDPSAAELFGALVRAACDLQTQIDTIDGTLATLNANYTIDCLEGVTASSDTHDVLQAVINKVCATSLALDALALDVDTNYVKLADLNSLIEAYISGTGGSIQNYTKMVPYTAVEYYGPLTNFDGTGAGINALGWDKIYLCNGLNSTPDKRGRVAVGAIVDVPGGPLNVAVDPIYTGNPLYEVYDVLGANTVALATSNIPSHTHVATATSTVTDPGHSHFISYLDKGNPGDGTSTIDVSGPSTVTTSTALTNITVSTAVSNSYIGDGVAHANIQPVLACYYIMYIPS